MPALKNVQPLSLIVYGVMLILIVARLPDGLMGASSAADAAAMLEVRDLSKAFGGLKAVDQASLDVRAGEIVGLIGPNGAGKTTLFAAIAGFHKPDAGRIALRGPRHHRPARRTGSAPPAWCAPSRSPSPSPRISVRENIMVGAYFRTADRRAAARWPRRSPRRSAWPTSSTSRARDLTVAGRKRLELARALATGPRLLLLDEVMAGLNPTEIGEIVEVIHEVRARRASPSC